MYLVFWMIDLEWGWINAEPEPPYTPEWLEWARTQPDFCEMCGGFHAEPLVCQVQRSGDG